MKKYVSEDLEKSEKEFNNKNNKNKNSNWKFAKFGEVNSINAPNIIALQFVLTLPFKLNLNFDTKMLNTQNSFFR